MIRIPIVKKLTLSHFIGVYGKEVKDNNRLLSDAKAPTALDTSTGKYVPQSVFCRYLNGVLEEIGASRFIAVMNSECQRLVERFLVQDTGLEFLASYSMHNRIHGRYEGDRFVISLDSCYPLVKQSRLGITAEIMAIYFVIHTIQKQVEAKPIPFAIRLQCSDTALLDAFDLNVPIYLEHGATQLVFDKECEEIATLVSGYIPLEPLDFSQNIELAIESYIGRATYSFEEYCELLEIHPRAMQRHLKEEGVTFRELKEKQNIKFAKRVLQEYKFSVHDVAIHLGYSAPSQFIRAFKRLEGTTPLQWLKQQS